MKAKRTVFYLLLVCLLLGAAAAAAKEYSINKYNQSYAITYTGSHMKLYIYGRGVTDGTAYSLVTNLDNSVRYCYANVYEAYYENGLEKYKTKSCVSGYVLAGGILRTDNIDRDFDNSKYTIYHNGEIRKSTSTSYLERFDVYVHQIQQ